MSPKRGDDVAQPACGDEWEIRYAERAAVEGWQELKVAAGENLRKAWDMMRHCPGADSDMPRSDTTNSNRSSRQVVIVDVDCPNGRSKSQVGRASGI